MEALMLCCVAVLFVLGLFRETWFRLPFTKRKAEPGFAPTALRPAPGINAPAVAMLEPAGAPAGRAEWAAPVLMAFGLGSFAYSGLVYGLVLSSISAGHPRPTLEVWLWRDSTMAMFAVTAILVARRLADAQNVSLYRAVPPWLLGIGLAWSLFGVADMHVFGLFHVVSHSADLLFHGTGVALAIVGAVALRRSTSNQRRQAYLLEERNQLCLPA